MNLRDKVGQRVMVTFPGPELTPEVANFIVESRAGGVIHFGHNITSLAQIAGLNRDLQDLAARHGLPPLMIGVDEEGGRVTRMPADGQAWIAPSQMAQSAAGPDAPGICAGVVARQLRRLGFNVDFAPVADVNNNPANPVIATRSYGSHPAQVSEAVVAAVKAYLAEDVAPCVKHFPGHGDTDVDSHLGLPVVHHSMARLQALELAPFRAAFELDVPAVMTAHILYPELEPEGYPATLSHYFLTRLLRQEMGFKGVVFSDALVMDAISSIYSVPDATFMTLKAGTDVAMPLGSFRLQKACIEKLVERAGELEWDESLDRILAFKERFCLPPLALDREAQQADARLIAEVARRSITEIGSRGQALSTGETRPVVVDFELAVATPVEDGRHQDTLLAQLLKERWPEVAFIAVQPDEVKEKREICLKAAYEASLLVIVTRNATRLPDQAGLLQELLAAQPRTIVVAARDPYDLGLTQGALGRLATYGDPPASIRALVGALFGDFSLRGELPVELE